MQNYQNSCSFKGFGCFQIRNSLSYTEIGCRFSKNENLDERPIRTDNK